MSAHTKTPWFLETVPTQVGVCHKIGPFPSGKEWQPETFACVYVDGQRLGQTSLSPVQAELLANAQLMTSAADLLETLKTLRNRIHSDICHEECCQDCVEAQREIDRAEGRS